MSDVHPRLRLLAVACVVACATTLLAQGWQVGQTRPTGTAGTSPTSPSPSGPAKPKSPATGLILGQVVDAGSGRPVPGAIVTITIPSEGVVILDGGRGFQTSDPAAAGVGPRRVLT